MKAASFPKAEREREVEKKNSVTKRQRRWKQAGRAREIMKKEWETWIRGGVDGEVEGYIFKPHLFHGKLPTKKH